MSGQTQNRQKQGTDDEEYDAREAFEEAIADLEEEWKTDLNAHHDHKETRVVGIEEALRNMGIDPDAERARKSVSLPLEDGEETESDPLRPAPKATPTQPDQMDGEDSIHRDPETGELVVHLGSALPAMEGGAPEVWESREIRIPTRYSGAAQYAYEWVEARFGRSPLAPRLYKAVSAAFGGEEPRSNGPQLSPELVRA